MNYMLQKPTNFPKTPGVYMFQNKDSNPFYVGKAGNLKQRLSFYFSKSPKGPRIEKMLKEVKQLKIIKTESEI